MHERGGLGCQALRRIRCPALLRCAVSCMLKLDGMIMTTEGLQATYTRLSSGTRHTHRPHMAYDTYTNSITVHGAGNSRSLELSRLESYPTEFITLLKRTRQTALTDSDTTTDVT